MEAGAPSTSAGRRRPAGVSDARPPIAITGATGGVGGRVARRLAERGVAQRLLVRDPGRAPQLAGAEAVAIPGYGDGEAMARALEGTEVLFLVSAAEDADRVSLHTRAVDAAVAAGVRRIVYLSFLAAAPDATFTFARDHFHTEQHIRASGLEFDFSRQSIYLDFVPGMAQHGVIRGPAGDGRLAPVARDDVADVVAALLLAPAAEGRAHDVTGPATWSFAELAAAIGRAAGSEVRFEDETLEAARSSRRGGGHPDWEIEGWVTSYAAVATGELDVVGDAVPRLTGHPATGVEEYLKAHPEALEPLRDRG